MGVAVLERAAPEQQVPEQLQLCCWPVIKLGRGVMRGGSCQCLDVHAGITPSRNRANTRLFFILCRHRHPNILSMSCVCCPCFIRTCLGDVVCAWLACATAPTLHASTTAHMPACFECCHYVIASAMSYSFLLYPSYAAE